MRRHVVHAGRFGSLISAALALTMVGCSSSNSDQPAAAGPAAPVAAAGNVEPDNSFYAGKTITWDIPGNAGSTAYNFAAIVGPEVAKQLHATIKLDALPAANKIVGQDTAAAAKPDGLTIGAAFVNADIAQQLLHQPTINFSLADINPVSGLHLGNTLVVSCPGSGIKTWQDVMNHKGTLKFVTEPVGASNEVLNRDLMEAYGIKATYLTGYPDIPSEFAGCLRGDGDLVQYTQENLASAIEAGKVYPMFLTAPAEAGTPGKQYLDAHNVPTLAQIVQRYPANTPAGQAALNELVDIWGANSLNEVVFTPKGTPQARTEALIEAFKTVMTAPATMTKFTKEGLPNGYISPEQCTAGIKNQIAFEPKVLIYEPKQS